MSWISRAVALVSAVSIACWTALPAGAAPLNYGTDPISSSASAPAVLAERAATTQVQTTRVAGANRYETAVLVSKRAFPDSFAGGTGTVYLARGDVFADALSAGSLMDGPILLVPTCGSAPSVVIDEVNRLAPARVVALGGASAVCGSLLSAVAQGRDTDRISGTNRYATALSIADARASQGPVSVAFVASGADTAPDAVAGGVLTGGPILTVSSTGGSSVENAARWIAAHPTVKRVIALGGATPVPDSVLAEVAGETPMERLAGANRYATAAAVASFQFSGVVPVVYLARGDVFADAVAGGALIDGPVLLTGSCALPSATQAALAAARPARVVALGGSGAVCDGVLAQAASAVPITQNDGVTVRPGVKSVTAPEDSGIADFEPATGIMTLREDSDLGATLVVGDVITSGVSATTPEGLLRKVTDITLSPDGYTVDTEPATLVDAIESTAGPLSAAGQLVSESATSSAPGVSVETAAPVGGNVVSRGTAALQAAEGSLPLGSHRWTVESSYTASGEWEDLSGTGSLGVEGSLTVSATADVTVDISFARVDHARVTVTPTATAASRAFISGEISGKVEHEIGHSTRVWNVQIGPVPLVITDESSIILKADVSLNGEASLSSSVTGALTTGFEYDDGDFRLIAEPNSSVEGPSLDASATLAARLSIGPSEKIKLYGIVGITGSAGPFAAGSASISLSSPAHCRLSAGLDATVGVTAGIEIAGIKLTPTWEQSKTFTHEFVDWEGPCTQIGGWTGTGAGWVITGGAIGPYRAGMTLEEASAVFGTSIGTAPTGGEFVCESVPVREFSDGSGVDFAYAFWDGDYWSIVYIKAPSGQPGEVASIRTTAGIGLGSTEAELVEAYGTRLAPVGPIYGEGDFHYRLTSPDGDIIMYGTQSAGVTGISVSTVGGQSLDHFCS